MTFAFGAVILNGKDKKDGRWKDVYKFLQIIKLRLACKGNVTVFSEGKPRSFFMRCKNVNPFIYKIRERYKEICGALLQAECDMALLVMI